MTDTPFNPEVHTNLITLGFTHTRFDADWCDEGNAESGPRLSGGPGWDEYLRESDMTKVCVDEDGSVGYFGDADPMDFADEETIARMFGDHPPLEEIDPERDVIGRWMGRNV